MLKYYKIICLTLVVQVFLGVSSKFESNPNLNNKYDTYSEQMLNFVSKV